MKLRSLIPLAVAAGFAITAQAADKNKDASAAAGSSNSGAEKMFQALDKNRDGFISREEAKGTPHDKDFTTLDKNSDGRLTRGEEPGKLYWYDADGKRHEVKDEFPGIRAF